MRRKVAILLLFLVLFPSVGFGQYTVTELTVSVGTKLAVSPEYLLCGLWVESKFFKDIGAPMAGLACAKVNRDGVVFYGLAKLFKKNPYTAPGSKAGSAGYGSAIGGGQILPSTYCHLSGISFTFKKLFSDSHKEYTKEDLFLIQKKLNSFFGRHVVVVDGCIGPATRGWIWQYVKKIAPQVAKKYVKDPGFVKTFFTIQEGYTYAYDPRKDQIAATLGVQGPLNPWDPVVSTTGMGLLLKKYGIQNTPRYACGAYFAGPGAAYKARGARYAKKFLSFVPWAIGEVDRYWLARGHRRR